MSAIDPIRIRPAGSSLVKPSADVSNLDVNKPSFLSDLERVFKNQMDKLQPSPIAPNVFTPREIYPTFNLFTKTEKLD